LSSYDNNQQEHGQDLNINAIVTTGIAFALITAVAIMYLYGLYLRSVHAEEVRKAPGLTNEVFALKQEQLVELATTGWVDAEAGVARIPIDEAIEKTVERYERSSDETMSPEETDMTGGDENATEGEDKIHVAGGDDSADLAGRPRE
jgi:hypothetical protein